jgi:hypothetical protein
MKDFVKTIRDKEKGKHYRLYASINNVNLPCEATFTNSKDRLGEKLYNEIFHVLVEIVELLGLISYKIITTDGTLLLPMPDIEVTPISVKDVIPLSLKGSLQMFAKESFISLRILKVSSRGKRSASNYLSFLELSRRY